MEKCRAFLASFLAAIVTFFSTLGAFPANLVRHIRIETRAPFVYGEDGRAYLHFRQPTDDTVCGTWWWYMEDALDPQVRDAQLDFLQKNGVNEIYFYGWYVLDTAEGRADVHSFVTEANKRGMTVSILMDDPTLGREPNSGLTEVADRYLLYTTAYPDDNMNGLHLDVEGLTTDQFVYNLISQFCAVRERGIPLSMDINCFWDLSKTYTMDGVTGNAYDILCSHLDSVTLMSYLNNTKAIWGAGENAYKAALRQNCKVIFAVETGGHYENINWSETFFDEGAEYMYTQVQDVYAKLALRHPQNGYGIAFHFSHAWFELGNEGNPKPEAA